MGRVAEADGTFGIEPAPGQDAPVGFPATAGGSAVGKGSEQLRFPRVHAGLASDSSGSLAAGVPDTAWAAAPGDERGIRMVSGPPARSVGRSARGAEESVSGPQELLWGEWQPAECGPPAGSHDSIVGEMAESSQPTGETDVGSGAAAVGAVSDPASGDRGVDLVRRIREAKPQKSRMVAISLSGSGRAPAGKPTGATRPPKRN